MKKRCFIYAAILAAMPLVRAAAVAERGSKAWGGEALIPLLILIVEAWYRGVQDDDNK